MRIVMATTTTCTRCPHIMKQLDRLGITYDAIDIAIDADLRDLVVNVLGYLQAPAFLLLDGPHPAAAAVVDHIGSYDKTQLRAWQDQLERTHVSA